MNAPVHSAITPSVPPQTQPRGLFVGLATFDVIHLVDHRPAANEKMRADRQLVVGGGPATNAAVTFAALGGQAALHTRLGASDVARFIRAEVTAQGVAVHDWSPGVTAEPPAAAIQVVAATGDRAVVSTHGQLTDDPPGSGAGRAADLPDVGPAEVVLLDSHYPAVATSVLQATTRPRGTGRPLVVLDGGSYKPWLPELLPVVDVAILSDDFALPGGDDPVEYLLGLGVAAVATTHGPGPVTWVDRSETGSVPVPVVRTVDTLGAGDVFHGAACYYLAAGRPLSDALAAAADVAALCVTSFGTRDWLAELP